MSPVRRERPGLYTSRCGDMVIRGHAGQIAAKYEELADNALRDKDRVLAETYLQHAHHWRNHGD